jgi:hypothetical protein
MQDEIVGKVVTTLGLIFKLDEMKTPHGASFRPTDNLEAYDDFLRGDEYYFRLTKEDNAKALQWFQEAIKLDSRFGAAYAAMGVGLLAKCMESVERESSSRPRAFRWNGAQSAYRG